MDEEKASPVEIQKYLSGVDYPATKDELISQAQDQGAPDDVITLMNEMEDREYESPTDVTQEVGKAE